MNKERCTIRQKGIYGLDKQSQSAEAHPRCSKMGERPEDLNLPSAVITWVIKEALPDGVNISKEAQSEISPSARKYFKHLDGSRNSKSRLWEMPWCLRDGCSPATPLPPLGKQTALQQQVLGLFEFLKQ
ncbi:hypothetical protein Y1Q_0008724 [Alligator mississippiensis]|uniref:Uncharacterized protein n=1 Tax=Alligator mississippiensis TaxID=8496 RepID=A0A151N9W6_ALLMI|nr:hypothetical protein Y1Q_0008724 [Alligator mississippiensis]